MKLENVRAKLVAKNGDNVEVEIGSLEISVEELKELVRDNNIYRHKRRNDNIKVDIGDVVKFKYSQNKVYDGVVTGIARDHIVVSVYNNINYRTYNYRVKRNDIIKFDRKAKDKYKCHKPLLQLYIGDLVRFKFANGERSGIIVDKSNEFSTIVTDNGYQYNIPFGKILKIEMTSFDLYTKYVTPIVYNLGDKVEFKDNGKETLGVIVSVKPNNIFVIDKFDGTTVLVPRYNIKCKAHNGNGTKLYLK